MFIDLMGMEAQRAQREARYTVLCRPDATWSADQVARLTNRLRAELFQNPHHPTYLVLDGGFAPAQVSDILGKDVQFDHKVVVGHGNPEIPFPIPWFR
jgi:hypothetical protein